MKTWMLGGIFAGIVGLSAAAEPNPSTGVGYFPLTQVRLLPGPFQHAQELDHTYVLALEPDRLLAGFRHEAGLEPKAAKYPNWESSGLDGHTLGHYLTALAQLWAATGDDEMQRRLAYTVDELAACQRANGNGYVGAVPQGRALWADIAAGRFDAQGFSLRGAWVPWYNVHKTFAGLRDAWLIAGHAPAREVLVGLADWAADVAAGLTDEQLQSMLRAEHGGMNEVLADVYAITGDARYRALAQRFSHRTLLDALLDHEDPLTGMHANTQIPKVIGYARIAELGGDKTWRDAATFFWDRVVGHRSVAFGGNSVREHFNPTDDFSTMLASREGPESCNTYNMLRLTEQLFRQDASARLADYYERALYNHILSTQHPQHGGFVYFTPIRPQHYRVYSQPTQCFWCCVGSGLENHGKYGRFIFAQEDEALLVNLFIAAELDWSARGITVRQETDFPDVPSSQLTFTLAQPQTFTVRVRHPGWVAAGALALTVNGEPVAAAAGSSPASYVSVRREWRTGDRLTIALPMRTTVEPLPDDSEYVAVVHGPIVLAAKTEPAPAEGLVAGDARMGHVAPGAYRPLDAAPMLVGARDTLAAQFEPVPGKPLTFTARSTIRPDRFQDLELVPFFRVHDARYMMYWRTATPESYRDVVATIAAGEQARLELERRTVDRVTPGEQQPEVEHNYRGERSASGTSLGRQWRDAQGWFSYDLRAPAGAALALRVTTFGLERGREFTIRAADRVIASVQLTGDQGERFIDTVYPIPADVLAAANTGTITITFSAQPDSRVAPIYDVRLIRVDQP